MPSPLLRLTPTATPDGRFEVEVTLDLPKQARQATASTLKIALTDQDQHDVRWYLEDYLQYPQDPAPKIAARIEGRMRDIGIELFRGLFDTSDSVRDLWSRVRDRLDEIRIEIAAGSDEATWLPWELLRDPETDTLLALRAQAFVRAHQQPDHDDGFVLGVGEDGTFVRILLVICRPRGDEDVPFRSVASRIIKGLSDEARAAFELDVLRPPTFAKLGETLHQAKAAGKPYHIVHFDGHGSFEDLNTRYAGSPPVNLRGYLWFENPAHAEKDEPIDGKRLGKLLADTGVPWLVLNACRSAHAEPAKAPPEKDAVDDSQLQAEFRNPQSFGSLAQEVLAANVSGVVAMRYNVYVVTAAQFIANLYAALAQGQSLGEAVAAGRKQLAEQPMREIAFEPRPLQDWLVPVVYEATPLLLFAPSEGKSLNIVLEGRAAPGRKDEVDLPAPPDVGFWGRDETILAIDRAFDTHHVVLLHAYAGSGKTSTAAEFARWYALTGGLEGPILFTSFEHYRPLPRALDIIGRVFDPLLEQQGIQWLAMTDAQRRDAAIRLLQQVPVLWIWDNVEPVAGFPTGAPSDWKPEEQQELLDFLRAAQYTKAKFLLTSRRDEKPWLGDLPARIALPPMRMEERVQFARALAAKRGKTLTAVADWWPLLQFTDGNPLTLTVVVSQALHDGLATREQIAAFVERLRAGEAAFEDEVSEGRSRSLAASLAYGFDKAFNETESRQLALLHLFQGFVNVDLLRAMGHPDADWCVPTVRNLTREAGMFLLDRAASIGLLSVAGGGWYWIHPALPWFFKTLFMKYYATSNGSQPSPRVSGSGVLRSFVAATAALGDSLKARFEQGTYESLSFLGQHESNLLRAQRIAIEHDWADLMLAPMVGLRTLYDNTGRHDEWAGLVNDILPHFINPATDQPLAGREDEWSLVTEFRVQLALEADQLSQAERLQRIHVKWDRQRAAHALAVPVHLRALAHRRAIATLEVSVHDLGDIQRRLDRAECAPTYQEALSLAEQIGDAAAIAACALDLGNAYVGVPTIRDFAEAERWYQHALELHDELDSLGRSRCYRQLGGLALRRHLEASESNGPNDHFLIDAARLFRMALNALPPTAVEDLALAHSALASVQNDLNDSACAAEHYREAVRYFEAVGAPSKVAAAQFGFAATMIRAGRLSDALAYAKAALRNYDTCGQRAADDVQKTKWLIAVIAKALAKQEGGGSTP